MRTKEEIQKNIDAAKGAISALYQQLRNEEKYMQELTDELHKVEFGWGVGSEVVYEGKRGIVEHNNYSYKLRGFTKDGSPSKSLTYIWSDSKVGVIKP